MPPTAGSSLVRSSKLNVLFVSVEMAPLVKVGGLGDVAGSLPKALVSTGVDVRVVLPRHRAIDAEALEFRKVAGPVRVATADSTHEATLWQGDVNGVTVYLVDCDAMFDRPAVYGQPDDTARWLFFCDALLALMPALTWQPEVLHLNDWHAAFAGVRLAADSEHRWHGLARVYTIHNLALKGDFEAAFASTHQLSVAPPYDPGIPPEMLLSGMAQGIAHSTLINTVSETYAKEMMTPEFGAGLDPLLQVRSSSVSGILNGIDYDEFDPATDPHITPHFSADDLDRRDAVRSGLLRRCGLADDGAAVVGFVNRLFWQKGADIAVDAFRELLAAGAPLRLVLLGTGDQQYHDQLLDLEREYPAGVKLFLAFDPALAQSIYAGSDMFLVPSRYEPCGLGQMIAMRYGSVPVVRRTGGLADTVPDADEQPERGRGFVFDAQEGGALAATMRRALQAYSDKDRWRALQLRGMCSDFSWTEAAGKYRALYERAAAQVRS